MKFILRWFLLSQEIYFLKLNLKIASKIIEKISL